MRADFFASSKKRDPTVRELVVVEPFLKIRTGYLNMVTASYLAELVEEATEPEHAEPGIYDLLGRGPVLGTRESHPKGDCFLRSGAREDAGYSDGQTKRKFPPPGRVADASSRGASSFNEAARGVTACRRDGVTA